MPKVVEMQFAIPSELGLEEEVLAKLRERVRTVEAELAAERRRAAKNPVGISPRACRQTR